jgi:hypothetical protein
MGWDGIIWMCSSLISAHNSNASATTSTYPFSQNPWLASLPPKPESAIPTPTPNLPLSQLLLKQHFLFSTFASRLELGIRYSV